jgi:hypothetical protein
VRIQVKPVETEVFVDGYFAGIVDDFDGFFQRLHLPPGEHEVQLYLEGYRSIRETLYLSPGSSYKIRHEMEALPPGERGEPRPQPKERSPEAGAPRPQPREPERARRPEGVGVTQEPAPSSTRPSRFGMLELRIQPKSTDISIDGESWPSSDETDETIIHLPAGRHRVEIRKHGYEPFVTDVEVRTGETTRLYVKLPPQGSQVD